MVAPADILASTGDLRDELRDDAAAGVARAAETALEWIRERTPVDTGYLQSRWQVIDAGAGGFTIENDCEYFWYVYGRNVDFAALVDELPEVIAAALSQELA